MHALHKRLVPPRTAVYVADDISRDPRQLEVRDEVFGVGELLTLAGRQPIHGGQIRVDIVISDRDRMAQLRAPDPVHRVDGPPDADAMFSLDGGYYVPIRDIVVESQSQT